MKKEYAENLLKKTTTDYNLIAEEFSSKRDRPWEELQFLFQDYLSAGDKILDLGCGNGRFLEFCKDKNIEYTGVDSSAKLIEIARKKHPDVQFSVADALSLPFPDSSFDKIYCIAVLHHIPSQEMRMRFMNEAKRVLKPGGLLVFTVWKFYRFTELTLLFKYAAFKLIGRSNLDFKDILEPWADKTSRYYHWFSQKEAELLAKKAGLKLEKSGVTENSKKNRRNIFVVAQK